MEINIDKKSGFCFGVVRAIKKAEEELKNGEVLYCLGDIVHNNKEVERLEKLGLKTIDHEEFARLHDVKVLLRAHGEPPSTYEIAKKNNITLVDASCPVVLKLQSRVKKAYDISKDEDTQIVVYGQIGHAEVKGLDGQTGGNVIVVENESDISKLDLSKNIKLFSQTTKSLEGFNSLIQNIDSQKSDQVEFEFTDTICRQVSNRVPNLTEFAQENDIVIFVSGKKSSNGKVLYQHCKSINPNSYKVSGPEEVLELDIDTSKKIGICGATSTPRWLMEEVSEALRSLEAKHV